jgi:hypothetical protein
MIPLMMMALLQLMNLQAQDPRGQAGQIPPQPVRTQGGDFPLQGVPLQGEPSAMTGGEDASPLRKGTLEAIQAAKQSLGMNDGEQKRAMGLALVKLFAGMSKPGYGDGLGGALSAAAQNMAPAVDAYMGEEGRVQNMNAALLGHVSSLQADQDKAWQHAVEKMMAQQHQNAVLEENKQYHQAQEKKSNSLYDLKKFSTGLKMDKHQQEEMKQRRLEEALERGETPLEVLEPSARADYQKNALKSIREIPTNTRALKTIAKMRDIFKKHEDIGTYKEQWLGGSGDPKKEAGFWTIFGRNISDKKKLAAIQQLKKHASDLNLATILGTPGKVGTDLLKRTIAESSPGGTLTKEAFDAIAKDWEERAHKNIRMAQKYQEGLRRKVMISDEENVPSPSSLTENDSLPSGNEDPQSLKASLDQEIAQLAEQIRQARAAAPGQGIPTP